MVIREELHNFDTIDDMEVWLNQFDPDFLRAYLFKEFDKVKYYETANQWNDAVRICEALAIIGWGNRDRVDAVCTPQDQWRETSFRSENNDMCFRRANWLPRKAGRYQVNYDDYNAPSHTDRKSQSYVSTREEDIVCTPVEKMLSQRNYLVKQPFWFPGTVDTSDASWLVADYTNQLENVMKEMIDPAPYCHRLESFRIWTSVGWAKRAYKFTAGRYYANRKAYDISLHIDRVIADLSETEQRLIIASGVREGVQAFIERLKKRKLDFPSEAFTTDVNLALSKFVRTKGLPSLENEQNQMRMLLTGFSEAVATHQKKERKERKQKGTEPTA